MEVLFKKITNQKSDFDLNIDELCIQGCFYRDKDLVVINAKINGKTPNNCFRCNEEFEQNIDTKVELKLSQNEYRIDKDDELLDIIEVFNDKINFEEIFISEINSIKSGYYACNKCQ